MKVTPDQLLRQPAIVIRAHSRHLAFVTLYMRFDTETLYLQDRDETETFQKTSRDRDYVAERTHRLADTQRALTSLNSTLAMVVKVKVNVDLYSALSWTHLQGAQVWYTQGISQFYLHTPRSFANGMNHTCLCLPSRSWYSFTYW